MYRLDELNLSWCYDFTEKHVQVAVAHVSETITQLNLSGYRKNLQRSGKTLWGFGPLTTAAATITAGLISRASPRRDPP